MADTGNEGASEKEVEEAEAANKDQNRNESEREHDLEALRTTQEEARTVLNHQIQTFNDVDDKAAKTSQLVGLLLGLLFTAGSFLAQADAFNVTPYFNAITGAGAIVLIISFIFALATYTTSKIETGVGSTDIQRLINKRYSEKGWLILLLRSEAAWMEKNEQSLSRNATLLTVSHFALVLAIILLAAGVVVVHWPS